jgi:hypothetical protein
LNNADAQAALLRVAVERPGPIAPETATWAQWSSLARAEHVIPLLYHLVDRVPTDLTDETREDLRAFQETGQSRFVRLEHHLILAAGLLAQHGIRAVALKGFATAHLDYPDPSWREVTDIDLLIDPADRTRALELLSRGGWVQGYALPAHHHDYTHAVTLALEGMELDLHQRISRRAVGLLVPTRELLDGAVPFDIAGAELLALHDIDRLIHSTIHAAVARELDRRLSSIADVLLITHRKSHVAGDVLDRAERWRVRPLVERGVLDACAAAQVEVPTAWADAMRRPTRRRDRLVEMAYLGEVRRPLLMELAYVRLLKGWRNRWRYAIGYFMTDPDYAAQHGRSGAKAQARYALAKLRSRSS